MAFIISDPDRPLPPRSACLGFPPRHVCAAERCLLLTYLLTALRIHVAEVGFCQKTPRGPSTCEGILANEMRSARSYRHASAPSAVRPRHEYALGPSSRQYLMKEVIRCHQASSAVLSRPQQSSGVISRTHQNTIDSTSSSSGVIRHHQASSGVIRRHQASSGVISHQRTIDSTSSRRRRSAES
jgi:hypothetical protein